MKEVKRLFLFLFLFFIGIITVNAETKNIEVTSVTVKEKSSTIEVAEPVISNNEITSNITFNQLNDYVTFELTLKNNESEKYKITSITDNNTNENLEVEYDYLDDYISSGDEGKVRVKLTYKNKLTNENISLDNLTITISTQNEQGDTSQIVLNPNTGDNILHFLVLLIIAITGLALIKLKKKTKVGILILIVGIIMIPFAVLAEEKLEISFKFANIEVKGEFETYNVTIDKGDGTDPVVIPVTYGEKIGELPDAPEKTGHTFIGWIDEENREITEDTVITGPTNLIPVYRKDKHELTITNPEYITEGDLSGEYEYGTQITLTAKTRDGFAFSKWSDNTTDNPKTITIGTSDITIEPIYTENKYTITFNPNGGTTNIESIKIDIGSAIGNFPEVNFEGYSFVGWFTEDDGGEEVTTETIPVGNITYYAHWEETDVPSISFIDVDNSETVTPGDIVKLLRDEFYVISIDGEKIKLISKYNLNLNYRQARNNNYAKLKYSNEEYWNLSKATSSSSGNSSGDDDDDEIYYNYDRYWYEYVYRTSENDDTPNNLVDFINNYKNYLVNDLDIENVQDVRLMDYEEAIDAGCTTTGDYCPSYIIGEENQNYWLGSVGDYENAALWGISSVSPNSYLTKYNGGELGVRPLVEIDVNSLNEYINVVSLNIDDEIVEQEFIIKNKTIELPTEVLGWALSDWYIDSNYSENVTNQVTPSGNTTYYARKIFEIVSFVDNDNNKNISLSDYVQMGDDGFWVIAPQQDNKVKLLVKYYLNSESRQAKESFTVRYSNSNYWWDNASSKISDKFTIGESGYAYTYRDKNNNDTDNNLKDYVNNYKNYLINDMSMKNILDARLMSYEEAENMGCGEHSDGSCPSYMSDYMYDGHQGYKGWYWLGSIIDQSQQWVIHDRYNRFDHGSIVSSYNLASIRPIVEVDKNSIANANDSWQIKFEGVGYKYIPKGESLGTLPEKIDGWYVEGWYEDPELTIAVTSDTIPIKHKKYYPKKSNTAVMTYKNLNNNSKVDQGDYVIIGDEEFAVLGDEDDNIKLLARYNVTYFTNLNNIYKQSTYEGGIMYVSTDNRYWLYNSEEYSTDAYGKVYSYRKSDKTPAENNAVKYVESYKDYLTNNLGMTGIIDARIMSYEERYDIKCDSFNCRDYIYNQSFWLGSVNSNHNGEMYGSRYGGSISAEAAFYNVGWGVRPIIVVSKSILTE